MTSSVILALPGIDPWLDPTTALDKKVLGTALLTTYIPPTGVTTNPRKDSKFRIGVFADTDVTPNELSAGAPIGTLAKVNFVATSGIVTHIIDAKIVKVSVTSTAEIKPTFDETFDWNTNRISVWNSMFPNKTTYSDADLLTIYNSLTVSTGLSVRFSDITFDSINLNVDALKELGMDATVYYIDSNNAKQVATSFATLPKNYMSIYRAVPGGSDTSPTVTFEFTLDILVTTGVISDPPIVTNPYAVSTNPYWIKGVVVKEVYTAFVDSTTKTDGFSKKFDSAVTDSISATSFFKKSPTDLIEKLTANIPGGAAAGAAVMAGASSMLAKIGGASGMAAGVALLSKSASLPSIAGLTGAANTAANDLLSSAKSVAAKSFATASITLTAAIDKAKGASGAASSAVSNLTGAASGAVSNLTGSVGGAVSNLTGAASGAVSNLTGAASGAVSNLTGSVGGAVSGVASNLTSSASGAVSKLTGAAGEASDKLNALMDRKIPDDIMKNFTNPDISILSKGGMSAIEAQKALKSIIG